MQLKESPTIHLCVGKEDMDDNKIAENIDTVIVRNAEIFPGKSEIELIEKFRTNSKIKKCL